MDTNIRLDDLRNEVLRKIGRNVVLFQELERILKLLDSAQRLRGPANELRARHEKRVAEIHRQSLGQLAGQFHDDFYAQPIDQNDNNSTKEAWLSFAIHLDGDASLVESSRSALASVVDERNEL